MSIPKCDWYHISDSATGQLIVRTDNPRSADCHVFWSPKEQPDGPRRIAVAPSVEQCINGTLDGDKIKLSGSDEVTLYIYDVRVDEPVVMMTPEDIDDADYNHEHGVTDDVICAEGGQIEIAIVGRVLVRVANILPIKIRIHKMYIDKSDKDSKPDDCFQREGDGPWFYEER